MAQPPLEYQIRHAAQILVCRTALDGAVVSYSVDETLKGVAPASPVHPDIDIFELLGYSPVNGEQAVLFFTTHGQLIELMPVRDGKITYAPDDPSVRRELTLDLFRREAKVR